MMAPLLIEVSPYEACQDGVFLMGSLQGQWLYSKAGQVNITKGVMYVEH